MGVLKVWDGTDWRKVGCGTPPTSASAVTEIRIGPDISDVSTLVYHRRDGVEIVNTINGVFTGSDLFGEQLTLHINENPGPGVSRNVSYGLFPRDPGDIVSPSYLNVSTGYTGAFNGNVINNYTWPVPDDYTVGGTVGRLKLTDGSQWVVERCSDDLSAGHPLKALIDGTWTTVACMVGADAPSGGLYDDALYDSAVYG